MFIKGDDHVKLHSLKVNNLYDCYNYSVKFSSDVTFLYGANGCGKTTILNIITDIITGKIYKLSEYQFSLIELTYFHTKKSNSLYKIFINYKDKKTLNIKFKDKNYSLPINDTESLYNSPPKNEFEIANEYYRTYPVLEDIRETFNYLYLPLNRRTNMNIPLNQERFLRRSNRILFEEYDNIPPATDFSMRNVEFLVRECFITINTKIAEINDNFRNQLLKSLLNINKEYSLQKIAFGMYTDKLDKKDVLRVQSAYMKILKEINLINEEEEKQYNKFFDDFINELEEKNDSENALLNHLLKFNEVMKIKEIVNLAEEMEINKGKARKPLEIFQDTISQFIGVDNEDDKKININSNGQIYFTTKISDKPVSIQHLSSGEKQLLTFFSNLIFGVRSNQSGIFVVDEPELSLHLSWQSMFVEKTLEINNNIQLIFATHSPEIIGKYRNKAYQLNKYFSEQ
jgi:predicted ATPase